MFRDVKVSFVNFLFLSEYIFVCFLNICWWLFVGFEKIWYGRLDIVLLFFSLNIVFCERMLEENLEELDLVLEEFIMIEEIEKLEIIE